MPRHASTQPTEVELHILRILWELGPSPVRDIHARLKQDRDTNYSTTVKMLSVMLDKGLVLRNDAQRPHVYRAGISQSKAQKSMLRDLVQKVYDGSTMSLVMQALSAGSPSAEELAEIRDILNTLEGRQ